METTEAKGAAVAPQHPRKINPVVFTVVPQADGTFDVEASDGGPSSFLISFQTRAEAEAWITKLKQWKGRRKEGSR